MRVVTLGPPTVYSTQGQSCDFCLVSVEADPDEVGGGRVRHEANAPRRRSDVPAAPYEMPCLRQEGCRDTGIR